MSNHLIDCAAQINLEGLPSSHKLLLLCLANDSRDGSGRIASPGLETAMTWTGLKRSALFEAYARLNELGLVAQHQRGQKRRNAEFLVFPHGCCELHRKLDRQDLPGLSGSTAPDPEPPVHSPHHRTLTAAQGPVAKPSGSGLADSGSGLDRTPPHELPRELPTSTPGRTAAPKREEEADWSVLFTTREAFDEFVAELRTIRRQHDRPTGRWTAHAVRAAIRKAVDAGYDTTAMTTAMRQVAADPGTDLPGRLVVAGPWWDAPELADLDRRRAERARALQHDQAATTAARAACSCDNGWVTVTSQQAVDDRAVRCPNCNPAIRSRTS